MTSIRKNENHHYRVIHASAQVRLRTDTKIDHRDKTDLPRQRHVGTFAARQ